MSTFTEEGTFDCTITEAMLAESKFSPDDPNALDVALRIESEHGEGWWTSELSEKYGKGNAADKTQTELTLGSLARVGLEIDMSKCDLEDFEKALKGLEGSETRCTVKSREYNGKEYFDIKYIGEGGFGPKKLDDSTKADRFNSLFGGSSEKKPKEKKKPAATAGDDNPFK